MFTTEEITRISEIINTHYSMIAMSVVGEEALTAQEKSTLLKHGIDIDKVADKFPPYFRSYYMGRLTAMLEDKYMREITNEDFIKYLEKGQFVPMSALERAEYEISRSMTYNTIKGLAHKITDNTRDMMLEQNRRNLIRETVSEAVKNRETVQEIVSRLGHKTGEWDRDWKRIAVTEMQNVYNLGKAAEIRRKYGVDSLVFKDVFEGACRHCISLYLTDGIGSKPIVFKLSDLIANGTNVGRKVADWKPVVESTHPHCRCDLRQLPKGKVWDDDKKYFVTGGEIEHKVERKSKVKITVNDKIFYI